MPCALGCSPHPAARGPGPTQARERAPVGGRGVCAGAAVGICILTGPRAGQVHAQGDSAKSRGTRVGGSWPAAPASCFGLGHLRLPGNQPVQVPPGHGRGRRSLVTTLSPSSLRSPGPASPGWERVASRPGRGVPCGRGDSRRLEPCVARGVCVRVCLGPDASAPVPRRPRARLGRGCVH